nr:hypothetical protein [Tanacetum cinerariifolium]
MKSLSPQVVAAAKLPILNPNEFDLWKMRMEQYFLMTDYSISEVILNSDSPTPTRVVDGVVQAIAPTTAEQRLAKKNKLKARGTLLIALLDKHQLKFNIHKDAKSLFEAIEKRFGGNKEAKKIYESEVKSSSSTSHTTQNIAFASSQNTDSTNESVSVIPSVSAASIKPPAFILPNVDNLSDVVIYSFYASQSNSPQLNNDDLKQIDADDLEEMDLKRGHFSRASRSPRDTKNKDTQRRNVLVGTSTSNALVSQCDSVGSYDWSFQADEEPTNYALMAFTSSSSSGFDSKYMFDCDKLTSSESDVIVPTSPVHDRYKSGEGYHDVPPPYTRTFMPPKPDLVFHDASTISETLLVVFNVEPSTTKPTKEMSQSNRPSTLIIEDWVSDSEDESMGEPMHTQKEPSFVQTSEHVKTPRISVKPVEHPTQAKNLRKDIPKSRGQSTAALKDKGVIDSGCSRHMTGNISYLSEFEEINKGYVSFGGNPKCDTECVVLSSDFKLPDENHVLLRVPRENNMYNVDLKNIVPSGDLTCLFERLH